MDAQSRSSDVRSMHVVNRFIHGIHIDGWCKLRKHQYLDDTFHKLGLGFRKKYQITENQDLTTALE